MQLHPDVYLEDVNPEPLDTAKFQPTEADLAWLQSTVPGCTDDEELKRRVLSVQEA